MAAEGSTRERGRDASTEPTLRATQAALAAEHAAVYGYDVVGGRIEDQRLPEAREGLTAHRARRDALQREVRALKGEPVSSAAAYALPFPVPDAAAAARLAGEIEARLRSVYADLVRAAEGSGPPGSRRRAARGSGAGGALARQQRNLPWAHRTGRRRPFNHCERRSRRAVRRRSAASGRAGATGPPNARGHAEAAHGASRPRPAGAPSTPAPRRPPSEHTTTPHGARGTGHGARGTGHGARGTGTGHGARGTGTGHGARGTGHGARGTGHGARGTGHGARGTGQASRR